MPDLICLITIMPDDKPSTFITPHPDFSVSYVIVSAHISQDHPLKEGRFLHAEED